MLWFNRIVKNFDFAIIIARYHHVTWTRITFTILSWIFVFLETWIGIEFRIAVNMSIQSFRWTWSLVQLIENQLWVRGKDRTSHQCIMRWKIVEHQIWIHATLKLSPTLLQWSFLAQRFKWDVFLFRAKFKKIFLVFKIFLYKLENRQTFAYIFTVLSHKTSDESWRRKVHNQCGQLMDLMFFNTFDGLVVAVAVFSDS